MSFGFHSLEQATASSHRVGKQRVPLARRVCLVPIMELTGCQDHCLTMIERPLSGEASNLVNDLDGRSAAGNVRPGTAALGLARDASLRPTWVDSGLSVGQRGWMGAGCEINVLPQPEMTRVLLVPSVP